MEAGVGPQNVAVDVGGGPGTHAAAWTALGALAVVVDPSPDMNRLARDAFPDLSVIRAPAERLPLRDDVATLVYFHLSIHHTRWRDALDEAVRVVAAGGTIEVITLGSAHHRQSMMQRWFPRIPELDEARFPEPDLMAAHLRSLGGAVTTEQTRQTKRRPARDWVAAVRDRFVSTLQLLEDVEIEDGLDRMIEATPDLDADLEYDMIWDRITARF